MKLSKRQDEILAIIKKDSPMRSSDIADRVGVSQATVRADLAILTAIGVVDGKQNSGYYYRDGATSNLKTKMENFKVSDLMKECKTVLDTDSVYDASIKMIMSNVSTVYVENKEGHLVGVLSRTDLLKSAIHGLDTKATPVALTMTKQPLAYISADDSVEKAAKVIVEREIDSIPVVEINNGKQKLLGRVTKTAISVVFVNILEG